jgi:hypothetical protein
MRRNLVPSPRYHADPHTPQSRRAALRSGLVKAARTQSCTACTEIPATAAEHCTSTHALSLFCASSQRCRSKATCPNWGRTRRVRRSSRCAGQVGAGSSTTPGQAGRGNRKSSRAARSSVDMWLPRWARNVWSSGCCRHSRSRRRWAGCCSPGAAATQRAATATAAVAMARGQRPEGPACSHLVARPATSQPGPRPAGGGGRAGGQPAGYEYKQYVYSI